MPFDPAIPVAGTVRLDLYGQIFGQTTINTFAYRYDGAAGDVTHAQMATAVEGQVAPLFSLLSSAWSGTKWRVSSYNVGGSFLNWTDEPTALNGLQASDSVPPGVALCIKKRSGSPGRQNRGRWYFAGLLRADHIDGMVMSASRGAFTTAVEDWDNPLLITDQSFHPIIQTYAPSGDVVGLVEIHSVQPDWVLRNMRRRQIGVGI